MSGNPLSSSCAVCGKKAAQSCSACNQVYYCTKEHQKIDWKIHKNSCAPFRIVRNEALGRFVVASRDISAGEIVLKKGPLILGPKMVSPVLCLGCHKKLDASFYNCSKCRWPLCEKACESSSWHKPECAIFAKTSFKPNLLLGEKQSIYSCIVPLRLLLLKADDSKKFETFIECQSHLEEHKQTQIYQILKRNLSQLFQNKFGLSTSEDEILEVCSILDTNSFEVRDGKGLVNIRGFYPTLSLLSHDCKHNTKHCYDEQFNVYLTATVPIKKGEKITTTYTQTLWGTLARRAHLKMSKHFDCDCLRCRDPTEFGTYAGSILCTCNENFKIVSKNPLDQNADWECEAKCGFVLSGKEMILENEALKNEISLMDKSSPENLEEFLKKYSKILHPSNCHVLEVKYALSQMYGNMPGWKLEELPRELLERKIELCLELLKVADRLEDGYSRFRGCLLYDLQAAIVVKTRLDLMQERIDKKTSRKSLEDCLGYLQEATKIFIFEPGMNQILDKSLNDLNEIISSSSI